MGTATEQSLRNILTELETHTLPTDAATQTTLALCLTALQLIDDLRNALGSVNTDDLQVDVKTSALPTDAATETTLALALTELTALLTELKLKADLTETQPVSIATMPTTTVRATGGDKIFAFETVFYTRAENTNLAVGENTIYGDLVPSGKVWLVTSISAIYVGTSPTYVELHAFHNAATYIVARKLAPASEELVPWSGQLFLDEGDRVRAKVAGATAGNALYLYYGGVEMDAPS